VEIYIVKLLTTVEIGFARSLFKEDVLSLKEFKELKKRIEDLQNGILIPSEQTVSSVIQS